MEKTGKKDELSIQLQKLVTLHEKVIGIYEGDKKRLVDHYEMLKQQYAQVVDEIPFSDDGVLEKAMNDTLKAINENAKVLTPVINSTSKLLETLIKAEVIKTTSMNYSGRPNIGNNNPIDLNSMQKLLEEE